MFGIQIHIYKEGCVWQTSFYNPYCQNLDEKHVSTRKFLEKRCNWTPYVNETKSEGVCSGKSSSADPICKTSGKTKDTCNALSM